MSETLVRIVDLVRAGEVRISAHGYDEIAEDGILAGEVIDGVQAAVVIEDYPTYPKGLVSLSFSRIEEEVRSTWSGASRWGGRRRRCW
jgi:hypothetical protein